LHRRRAAFELSVRGGVFAPGTNSPPAKAARFYNPLVSATFWIVLFWIGFAATHMVLSSVRLRPRLVRSMGEPAYLGVYSAIAFLFFVPLCWVYFTHRHEGPVLWSVALGTVELWIVYLLQGVAWVLVVAGAVQPSPASLAARPAADAGVRGVHRLARHPVFSGIGLFGALHLLSNGTGSDVAFFAGFPVFGMLGAWHQDRRKLKTGTARFGNFLAKAPFIPFTGRETLPGLRELRLPALAIGIALTVALRWLHGPLFGS
jgi:uncharacterized membrane protein